MASEDDTATPPPARRPWPLRWIVLAIVLYAVLHAVATLLWRKA